MKIQCQNMVMQCSQGNVCLIKMESGKEFPTFDQGSATLFMSLVRAEVSCLSFLFAIQLPPPALTAKAFQLEAHMMHVLLLPVEVY